MTGNETCHVDTCNSFIKDSSDKFWAFDTNNISVCDMCPRRYIKPGGMSGGDGLIDKSFSDKDDRYNYLKLKSNYSHSSNSVLPSNNSGKCNLENCNNFMKDSSDKFWAFDTNNTAVCDMCPRRYIKPGGVSGGDGLVDQSFNNQDDRYNHLKLGCKVQPCNAFLNDWSDKFWAFDTDNTAVCDMCPRRYIKPGGVSGGDGLIDKLFDNTEDRYKHLKLDCNQDSCNTQIKAFSDRALTFDTNEDLNSCALCPRRYTKQGGVSGGDGLVDQSFNNQDDRYNHLKLGCKVEPCNAFLRDWSDKFWAFDTNNVAVCDMCPRRYIKPGGVSGGDGLIDKSFNNIDDRYNHLKLKLNCNTNACNSFIKNWSDKWWVFNTDNGIAECEKCPVRYIKYGGVSGGDGLIDKNFAKTDYDNRYNYLKHEDNERILTTNDCKFGEYLNNESECVVCPDIMPIRGKNNDICKACDAGQQPNIDFSDCEPCPVNTFKNYSGWKTPCISCPEGSYTNNKTGSINCIKDEDLKTSVFDDVIKKNKEKLFADFNKVTESDRKDPTKWSQLRESIDNHAVHMFRLQSEHKYKEDNQIDNVINKLKQKYNDDLCKKYVKHYKFDTRNVEMVTPKLAELKPTILKFTGHYSEDDKECKHPDPTVVNKFECPESIICPNNRTRSKIVNEVFKNYEPVCQYTC